MERKSLVTILAVIGGAIVLVIAAVVASKTTSNKKSVNASNLNMVSPINEMLRGIPQQGTALGNPKAKLTLVEFADPQCSACGTFSGGALPQVIATYVRTGRVRIEFEGQTFIDRQVSQDSKRLLRMALAAAKQNRFWNFIEIVYANQGTEDSGYATDAFLKAIANSIAGLDTNKAFAAAQTSEFDPAIKASAKRFENGHFGGTPSFLLGPTGKNQWVRIAPENITTFDDMKGQIDAELAKLRK